MQKQQYCHNIVPHVYMGKVYANKFQLQPVTLFPDPFSPLKF